MKSIERLPHLAQLESLSVCEDLDPVTVHKLLKAYSGHLKRLRLNATSLHVQRGKRVYYCRWELNFPKLAELEIRQLKEEHMKSIWRILGVFWNIPSLIRLQLGQVTWGKPNLYLKDDLFPLIEKKFPRLQSFISAGFGGIAYIQDERPETMGQTLGQPSSISATLKCTSLTFLKIEDHGRFSYKFLHQLPNLQYFHIHSVCTSSTVIDHSNDPYVVTMKESMQSGFLYRSPIWEALPRLKEIGLRFGYQCPRRTKVFDRSIYDKMRVTGNWTILQPGDYQPLREDISEYMRGEAEAYERWPFPDRSQSTDNQRTERNVHEINDFDDLSDIDYSELDGYYEDEYIENSISDVESSSDFTSESEGGDRD